MGKGRRAWLRHSTASISSSSSSSPFPPYPIAFLLICMKYFHFMPGRAGERERETERDGGCENVPRNRRREEKAENVYFLSISRDIVTTRVLMGTDERGGGKSDRKRQSL